MIWKNVGISPLRRLAVIVLLAVSGVPERAWSMEDDPFYSYTRIEAAAGSLWGRPGSAQSLALDGWAGYDIQRLWWQAEGARQAGKTEGGTAGVWYGKYVAPFWDAQIGVGRDGGPQNASYLSAGVRGLAPYQYDTDIKLNVRSDGKLFARVRFETEFLMTNRLILRPWLDAAWSGSNVNETVRAGIYQLGFGLQARYEVTRKFAPYLELSRNAYSRAIPVGYASETQLLAGVRLIF